jgi:hypothetical protein
MSRTRRKPGEQLPSAPPAGDDPRHERSRERRHVAEERDSLGLNGALQGAARYSLLNMPEPVAAADSDFNRGVTREEFKQAAAARFQLLDKTREGKLTLSGLEAMLPKLPMPGSRPKRRSNEADGRIGNPLPPGN